MFDIQNGRPLSLTLLLEMNNREFEVNDFTSGISLQSHFILDNLQNVLGSGRRMKFDRMILSVHKMKSGVNGPSVDGAQDLLFGQGPLSPSRSLRFEQTLLSEPGVFSLLGHVISTAFLQMCDEVPPDGLVGRQDHGAGQAKKGPVA